MDNSTNNMSEKLLQYLDGELPGVEKEDLEKQIALDKNLQNELENLKLARAAIRSYGLKQKIGGIHEEMMNELETPVRNINSNKSRRIIRYTIAIAASVLVVFLATAIFKSNSLSPDKLFAENYHAYELSTTRDDSSTETPIEKTYKDKDYKQVSILTDTSASIKNIFLSAMSHLELKEDSKAIEKYKLVIAKNESAGTNLLKDEAEYYLALAYLRNKEYAHSLELMNKIHNSPSHLYRERITDKLIQDVKKLN